MRHDEIFLDTSRREGDLEADEVIRIIVSGGSLKEFYRYLSFSWTVTAQSSSLPVVKDFLLRPAKLPMWYDEERLRRGQKFFKKYALEIMGLLGALSLPYCYAASPGNKAIYFTEKMKKSPGKRLTDTAHFIIEVMRENALSEGGNGSFEIQKTRLIHALVRSFILSKTAWDSAWGMPVNQEDMAGTNLAFSYIILRGMEQSEFRISAEEKEDFLFAWRLIGHQLAIKEELLPASLNEASMLEEAIRLRHFRKSEEGQLLTSELIEHYKVAFPRIAAYFVDSQIRYFIGPEVAELLGVKQHPWKDRIVSVMNDFRKKINRRFVNPYSYDIMFNNHLKLKKKYSEG